MSEDNLLVEIAGLMTNKNAIQQDMSEAMGLVQNLFAERYFGKLNHVIQEHQARVNANPSREVHLLKAFKAFMPSEKQADMDKMINTLLLMDTVNSIKQAYSAVSVETQAALKDDPSIHEDGIYDVDTQCAIKKEAAVNPMLPLFMLMAAQKR